MIAVRMPACYQHLGLVLVRATTAPGDIALPADNLNVADDESIAHDGRDWLAKTWAEPQTRDAIHAASPGLAARVEQLLNDDRPRPAKRWRGVILSVAGYLMRWQRRATPFGLFAGVTVASCGAASAQIGTHHQTHVRADAEWLAEVTGRLEHDPTLRAGLTVVADNARIVRDGRVITYARTEPGTRTVGGLREVSVRLTRPVHAALDAAHAPTPLAELVRQLTRRFPTASPAAIHALLDGLIDAGLLLTNLHAPMTTLDALGHLLTTARAAASNALPATGELLDELTSVHDQVSAHNAEPDPQEAAYVRRSLTAQMARIAPAAAHTLAIDTRLEASISIPDRVLTEAARAADVLLRMTTQPFGSPAWLDYHARFRARYGHGALVGVRELVADSGLGYPAGYLDMPGARPTWRTLTERDASLLALIHQAALDGADEIALTDADIDALTLGAPNTVCRPERVELGVALYAESTAAIDAGRFQLWVTAAPRTPTSMAGRFAALLKPGDRQRLAASYTAGRDAEDDVLAVQLSFPPRRPHNENIVRVAPQLSAVIALSEQPPSEPHTTIDLDDLAVTADAGQMYLVHRPSRRRVAPQIAHALDLSVQTPPLARFLAEVATARSASFRGFDFGAARTLPYVPRIRYRNTVLAPARWLLHRDDLTDPSGQATPDPVSTWRHHRRVPSHVVLTYGDLHLPLNLDHSLDRALLRSHVQRSGRVEIREDGPANGHDWIGRPAELLIPLAAPHPTRRPLPAMVEPATVAHPGHATVVHAQLAGNADRFDAILAHHVPQAISALGERVTAWWVRRHRDLIRPDTPPRLALFLRLATPEDYGPVTRALGELAAALHRHGLPATLSLAPFYAHPGRYGQEAAQPAAEAVFAADTRAAISQIRLAQDTALDPQALAAVSMARIAAAFASDPSTGYHTMLRAVEQTHGRLNPALRDTAARIAGRDLHDLTQLEALPGGPALAAAWRDRDTVVTHYHRALTGQHLDPIAVLRSLMHDQHTRALAISPSREADTLRVARGIALRHLAAPGTR